MIRWRILKTSFYFAGRGLVTLFRTEQSFRTQTLVALGVVVLAYAFSVSSLEWILLLSLSAAVLILEAINSIVERIADAFKPRLHPIVRDIKDMMAGAVLIASLLSVAVGVFIFLPKILLLLSL